jgi:subtilisin family serine protease
MVSSAQGVYGRASAVSAANPIVTGIIALLLEMDPSLDAAQVKELLHRGARADAFTGVVPNPQWGYGKVNALGSVEALHAELARMTAERLGADQVRVRARGQRGGAYVLQSSADLGAWVNRSTNRPNPTLEFTLPTGNGGQFLRLLRRPDL